MNASEGGENRMMCSRCVAFLFPFLFHLQRPHFIVDAILLLSTFFFYFSSPYFLYFLHYISFFGVSFPHWHSYFPFLAAILQWQWQCHYRLLADKKKHSASVFLRTYVQTNNVKIQWLKMWKLCETKKEWKIQERAKTTHAHTDQRAHAVEPIWFLIIFIYFNFVRWHGFFLVVVVAFFLSLFHLFFIDVDSRLSFIFHALLL